jgi:hypothetical protein
MTDSTTPVQDDLLGRIAAASNAGKVEELRHLVTLLPAAPKAAPHLLVIDPEGMPIDGNAGYWSAWASEVLAGPDVMELIEQVIEVHDRAHPMADPIADSGLLTRIRTALEGATQ